MKITLNVPEWAMERHWYFMAGMEPFAYKLYGEDVLHVKVVRCVACGECCRNLPKYLPDVDEQGNCKHLGACGVDNECGYEGRSEQRPFQCSVGLQQKGRTPKCSIEYEIVKL